MMKTVNERAKELASNPKMSGVARWLAESFLSHQTLAPRAASIFTTQQKWLLAHIAASLYFRSMIGAPEKLTVQAFIKKAVDHKVASRNTAKDFLFQLIKYNFGDPNVQFKDIEKSGAIEFSAHPTQETQVNLSNWYLIHLNALDMLDGRSRVTRFTASAMRYMALMEPMVTEGFLTCPEVRQPEPIYALFAWADEGGLLMDRFITGLDRDCDLNADRLPINVTSVTELSQGFNLSRVHTARLLSKAEEMGAIGWEGRRGHSSMWISRTFHDEYRHFQALKMVIIDDAFNSVPEVRPGKN